MDYCLGLLILRLLKLVFLFRISFVYISNILDINPEILDNFSFCVCATCNSELDLPLWLLVLSCGSSENLTISDSLNLVTYWKISTPPTDISKADAPELNTGTVSIVFY